MGPGDNLNIKGAVNPSLYRTQLIWLGLFFIKTPRIFNRFLRSAHSEVVCRPIKWAQ